MSRPPKPHYGRGGGGGGGGNYRNNSHTYRNKTYSAMVRGGGGGGIAVRENVPVTEEEWGEGALILTPDSPPSKPLAADDDDRKEKGKLPRVPEHAPAPQLAATSTSSTAAPPLLPRSDSHERPAFENQQAEEELDVDPEVLRMTLEALGVSGHEDFVNPDLLEEEDGEDITAAARGGPRLRVDKDVRRIVC
ncbi:hypothetical protein FOL47_003836 [Perkinsus chesapeaki]|uniref:Uncharacterized protein n=1 Tax=Perkinsus chesapeaki TaxID=330153 RepID=A0A7J6M6C3_PERCH|nr:hypothetical protein FOL47_003836 [Perkinsus chesapeaki]